ncbi:Xylose isomerase-like TIM barrel [Rubripirellula lacrimiformis]|uniref:Xylose isomerase-like TIM barrel n=1 Tax=Rubripirellula lacrimiformis TaxID=1930273 RepID=A0A517NEP8_9BACT|nr:sugar phosphate isomerase/epimerase family protein [Rubripirellula lacrimiformis]QDT05604.1 Xylose isomerase-like TIM barrel [Rubripirellula lacrimiformis]
MSPIRSRRDFLAAASATAAASMFVSADSASADQKQGQATSDSQDVKPPVAPIGVFTKPLNSISFDEMADVLAEAGFDGIEAPVRPGGNVEPEKVEDDLPRLVEALDKRGLKVLLITTDIRDASDPLTKRVLRTAATLGIQRYRMEYLKYDLNQNIADQIQQWRPGLQDLAALNHSYGIQGLYQNHAGKNYFGAPIWDLHLGLQGIAKSDLGVAYDIRHGIAEGGMSWPVALELIRPHIGAMYIKDFKWDGNRLINVPLGEGRVGKEAIQAMKLGEFDGPISLHEEYLDHRKPELVPDHLKAMKTDLQTLKQWI